MGSPNSPPLRKQSLARLDLVKLRKGEAGKATRKRCRARRRNRKKSATFVAEAENVKNEVYSLKILSSNDRGFFNGSIKQGGTAGISSKYKVESIKRKRNSEILRRPLQD